MGKKKWTTFEIVAIVALILIVFSGVFFVELPKIKEALKRDLNEIWAIIAIFGVLPVVIFCILRARDKFQRRLLRDLAIKKNIKFDDPMLGCPGFTLKYNNIEIEISYSQGSRSEPQGAHASVHYSNKLLPGCLIFTSSMSNQLLQFFESPFAISLKKSIKTSNPAFDSQYVIKCNDEEFISNLLNGGIMNSLLLLKDKIRVLRMDSYFFDIMVTTPQNESEYNELIDLAKVLCGRISEMGWQ